MTHDQTPEARSGEPSPPRSPASGLVQAVGVVAVVAITLGTVGVLLMSRNARNVAHQGLASGSRLASPSQEVLASPTATPALVVQGSAAHLYAPSTNVVWTLVGGALLFRSMDRGDTWEQRSLPSSMSNGFEVSFVDDRQGWLYRAGVRGPQCTDSGAEVWRTTDGAATWKQVAIEKWTGNTSHECKQGLSFTDPEHGFIGTSPSFLYTTIFRTVDGGKNWTGIDVPTPSPVPQRAGLVKKFGSTMYVTASGTKDSSQHAYRSTDGGATWSWMTKVPPGAIVMVTESRWLILEKPGQSSESTTSGQQWHYYASDFTGAGPPVFADSQTGYADANGALLRTLDGGLRWERISTPGLPKLDAIPITDPGFTCRLAVGSGSFGTSSTGGFVAVPRGAFVRDPAAPTTTGSGLAFDAPFSRWVPASPEVISADGSEYAWTERQAGGKLHVTRVADGMDRTFAVEKPPDAGPIPVPIAITKDGVLLTYGWEGVWGVWRLDRASGSLTKLTGLPSPSYGAGAIWATPTRGPDHVGMYSDGDTLARLDLKTGAVQDWYHRDNVPIYPLGFDLDGNPWVQAVTYDTRVAPRVLEIWRIRGPGQADLIVSGQRISRVITDSHGTWFANESGVYLYSSGRLQRVSSASVGEVVGPCV